MTGAAHAAVTGTVVGWGANDYGQSSAPSGLHDVVAVAGGSNHTVALKRDGSVVAWGIDVAGQLDIPAGLRDVMAIGAGHFTSLAVRSSYRFGGFLAPVNAPPVVNTLRAGAGVPVRFRLGGNQGLAIFANGYPVARTVACDPDARTDEVERTVQADRSRLSYDGGTDVYTFTWKTEASWSGQCRRLILRLADGIEHTALFRFR
jgi:hypothetical protein